MRITALLYHDVVPRYQYETSGFQSADANIYKLECQEFRQHMRAIAGCGLRPDVIENGAPQQGERRIALTFDDGGASAIEHTAAILGEFGWRGHFFVTTGFIGEPGFLNEQQIRGMRGAGHVIGSHSCTHPLRMAALSRDDLDREWRESVDRLQQILGERVHTASIPGGYYSGAVANSAASAGIRVLFTSEPTIRTGNVNGCLTVGRFSVQQGVSAGWVAAVVANRVMPRARSFAVWKGKKLLKAAGGPVWLAARKAILAQRGDAEKRRARMAG